MMGMKSSKNLSVSVEYRYAHCKHKLLSNFDLGELLFQAFLKLNTENSRLIDFGQAGKPAYLRAIQKENMPNLGDVFLGEISYTSNDISLVGLENHKKTHEYQPIKIKIDSSIEYLLQGKIYFLVKGHHIAYLSVGTGGSSKGFEKYLTALLQMACLIDKKNCLILEATEPYSNALDHINNISKIEIPLQEDNDFIQRDLNERGLYCNPEKQMITLYQLFELLGLTDEESSRVQEQTGNKGLIAKITMWAKGEGTLSKSLLQTLLRHVPEEQTTLSGSEGKIKNGLVQRLRIPETLELPNAKVQETLSFPLEIVKKPLARALEGWRDSGSITLCAKSVSLD